jgi:hypothetical protein
MYFRPVYIEHCIDLFLYFIILVTQFIKRNDEYSKYK